MKQDKFLTGILIGIGALIILAAILFFVRRNDGEYQTEGAPQAVVHNYILAAINKDYVKAYGYLADLENKPTYEEFRRSFLNGNISFSDGGVEIGAAEITGNEAYVALTMRSASMDIFPTNYSSSDQAFLAKQDGAWKLVSMPYYYWSYDWYQDY
ncbi:MAG: hypothetical protein B6D38_04490 [Anaerolineae bacterium UTCFX1]|nr:MAG: hypothetical protein B6D38_04490 [Anaerolineae bacterium UTCFX1]